MVNLDNGARVAVNTRQPGSCLHGVKGTIVGSGTLLGNPAYRVRFDSPVRYPMGNIAKEDLIFVWEAESLCEHEVRSEDDTDA